MGARYPFESPSVDMLDRLLSVHRCRRCSRPASISHSAKTNRTQSGSKCISDGLSPTTSVPFKHRNSYVEFAVLLDKTLLLNQELFARPFVKPIRQITVRIKLITFIIECMRDFVTNYRSDDPIIHIFRTIHIKYVLLEDTGRNFYGNGIILQI